MYRQVDVVVDGSLDLSFNFELRYDHPLDDGEFFSLSHQSFGDWIVVYENGSFDSFIDNLKPLALADGLTTEVYIIDHDHTFNESCECVQYLQDHKPMYSWDGISDNPSLGTDY